MSVDISIHENPFDLILTLIPAKEEIVLLVEIESENVILPLYSPGEENVVQEKSGLNHWNAWGRRRDSREVYIPIPRWIHNSFPGFFPPRDHDFSLLLHNNRGLTAKICQDNDKALMSNPNRDLGVWLLGEVLRLRERELLKYEKLEEIVIDSAMVIKIDDMHFEIDFKQIGTYEKFKEENDIANDDE